MAKVELRGRTLTLDVTRVRGRYEGEVTPEGDEIRGTWSQGGARLPLVFRRAKGPVALPRPQHPKPPFPYRAEDVRFAHRDGVLDEQGPVRLAGTLTLPPWPGPHPGVVLISGSGPQDRDETLLAHKPFLVLADYLTRRGFAVLRYDDRGVGESTGDFGAATSFDFAHDAAAALRFLAARPEVDAKRCGLCGHSEGGLIAPLVASRQQGAAFCVLLAGPAVDGEAIVSLQSRRIQLAMGVDGVQIARSEAQSAPLRAIAKEDTPRAEAERRLRAALEKLWEGLTPAERQQVGAKEAFLEPQLRTLLSPWFRTFLRYDPAPALRQVRCPVLALNGALDLQVDAQQNLPVIARELEAGHNPDYAAIKLPGLNHLFQTCRTGAPAEYGKLEETFSPLALQTVGDWLRVRFVQPR
ncbi:MAG: alpha/beta hydrolase family protein [Planctomycetota bacterium]